MKSRRLMVVYLSPAGTTKTISSYVAKSFADNGYEILLCDLKDQQKRFLDLVRGYLCPGDCLWIGSPIYACHTVPQVEEFIADLPDGKDIYAVPFVTYGGVVSGTGLYEMASVLKSKRYSVIGAAKVLAVHSLLWFCENPIGKGHPGPHDTLLVNKLIRSALKKISAGSSSISIDIDDLLNYQSPENRKHSTIWNLETLKNSMPPTLHNKDKCDDCGVCIDNCPTYNLSLSPEYSIGNDCILCFNCIRACENQALSNASLGVLENAITDKIEIYQEPQETRVFY